MRVWCWPVLLWPCLALAASGSWSGTVGGPRVAGPGRMYASAPLNPPAPAAGARIRRVHWRYGVPADRRSIAELCAGQHCVPLNGNRGVSDALAGTPAAAPLALRFRLPPGERRSLQVGVIQLLVDYR
ncbi:MAG TPA: flagellar protein FlhE [Rhodanobacteraceae bacterium]